MKLFNPCRVIWLAIFLLVASAGEQLLAQPTLKKLEYSFDSDPGVGKGTVLTLSSTQTIDDTFSFDVNVLTDGVHIIHYRIMDSDNRWSLTQSTPFLKLGGNSTGTTLLKKLEYSFDGDPGVGNGKVITLPAIPDIDNIFSFDVSTLTDGIHLLRYRIMDDYNNWSLTQTVSFLKLGGNSNSSVALLKKLEYAFDASPAITGNGIQVELPAVTSIDSLFTLDVKNIADGIHMLYYRVQDIDNKWSLPQATSFLKFGGDNNGSNITRIEYFVDTDPGVGKGTALPFTPGNNITDTFTFVISGKGNDSISTLYIRVQDNTGAWSLWYSQKVNTCTKTEADFTITRYGDRYAFSDSSKYNAEGKYLWNFDGLGMDTIANPLFDFPRGNHKITLITGTGCRADTVQKSLYTSLESYYPNKGMRGTDLAMRFFGSSLDTNVIVELRKGATVIAPFKRLSKDYKQLLTMFDLHTVEGGVYNIRLKYKDGFDTTIVNGLVVDANFVEPELEISLNGPEALRRSNEWTYYTITVTNRSNSLAKGVPFWIVIPNNVEYQIDTKIFAPPGFQGYPLQDSIPVWTPLDSLEGTSLGGRMFYVIAPLINANETFQFKFRLRSATAAGDFGIYYGVDMSMFGSPLKYLWGDCFDDMLFLILNAAGLTGAIPTGGIAEAIALSVDAIAAIGDLLIDNSLDIINGDFSALSFAQSLGNAVLSGTGLAGLKKLGGAAIVTTKLIKNMKDGTGLINNLNNFLTSNANFGKDCFKSRDRIKKLRLRFNNSRDPNGINGPVGYGDNHFINGKERSTYTIEFENLASAGAAAQQVFISDTLDKAKFDFSSFELGAFRIADSVYTVPMQRKSYTTLVDMRPKLNMLVRYTAQFDTASGILNYSFMSLDPVTKNNLDDHLSTGFLPPNKTYPVGNGSVSYNVALKASLTHNDVVSARASIVFDRNAALLTNTWLNKLDKKAPALILPGTKLKDDTTISLRFTGTDDGSGMQYYVILVSINGGALTYVGTTNKDSVTISGKYDSSYKFIVVPFDNVSNGGDSAIASVKFAIQQATQNNNMLVYPNPGKGRFTVLFNSPEQQEVTANVYSMTGQLLGTIYQATANGIVTLTPDISRLSNGVYILQIKGSKGLKLQSKIIIQH